MDQCRTPCAYEINPFVDLIGRFLAHLLFKEKKFRQVVVSRHHSIFDYIRFDYLSIESLISLIDTFAACWQVRNGAHAIFGPSDPHLGAHVQSICDALEIPHLEVNTNHSLMPIRLISLFHNGRFYIYFSILKRPA